ncbi:MAG: serine/threonine protein kinase [Gammaproteobacteria bacterium]
MNETGEVSGRSGAGYSQLSPDRMLDAVEAAGFHPDGRFLELNSYENRVFRLNQHDAPPVVAKFYRAGRWEDAAILEEHAFALELAEHELPVAAPIADSAGETLHHFQGFRFAIYPCWGGHAPELDNPEHLGRIGRLIARIHNVGALRPFRHRPALSVEATGLWARTLLLENGHLPADLEPAYEAISEQLLERVRQQFERAGNLTTLRLHGDCHPGNILWNDSGPGFVDLDDARTGPAVQDLWMFLSGDRGYRTARLADLLDEYTRFRDFDARELHLIEPLRTLRIMHYAGWLAARWDDPAFQRAFPWFGTQRYWEEHILALKEQASALDEPVLVWD